MNSELSLLNFEEIVALKPEHDLLQTWSSLHSEDAHDEQITDLSVLPEQSYIAGVTYLFAFIQDNFTGPKLSDYPDDSEALVTLRSAAKKGLQVDSEEINVNVSKPEYLFVSKLVLEKLLSIKPDLTVRVWNIRLILIHQRILDEMTGELYEKFVNLSDLVVKDIDTIPTASLQAQVLLEIAQGYLMFRRVYKTEQILDKVKKCLGAELEVEGLMGLRTKFQVKALPQLVLRVNSNEKIALKASEITHKDTQLPLLLRLDDDVRLEKIKFCSDSDNKMIEIPAVVQDLVLAQTQLVQLSQPSDTLADEQLMPFLATLLHQSHGPWPTRIATLLINIKLEATHKRTVERSLKQCEEIIKIINSESVPIPQRLSHIFASGLRPIWGIKNVLGNLMISLGLIKTALDLFLQIQAWEEIIACYTMLDLKHKAAEIIQQELDKKPTTKLYCLLGDATDNVEWYKKAWEFSYETSGIAQRHWGYHFFAKKEYEKAIVHLQKSLEINSLQEICWLRLGYAALKLENWEIAASAYRRYTQLEPYGFESWNNLAKAYIKLGDKVRAHKVLSEAIKCNYNNWKVWENFLLVSIDTGHFDDVINSFDRLIELQGKYCDKEVLEILVNAVVNNLADAEGRPAERLAKKTQTLLGHLSVQLSNESFIWELSAKLHKNDPLACAQKLQKAFKCLTQVRTSWAKDSGTCNKVLNLCIELCIESLGGIESAGDSGKSSAISQLASARLSAQGCIKAATAEQDEQYEHQIKQLQELLEKCTSELKRHL